MIHYNWTPRGVLRSIGIVCFSLGMIFMPGNWWAKVLIWFGVSLLVGMVEIKMKST